MRLWVRPGESLENLDPEEEEEVLEEIARRLHEEEKTIAVVKGGPEAREASTNPLVEQFRQALIATFGRPPSQ